MNEGDRRLAWVVAGLFVLLLGLLWLSPTGLSEQWAVGFLNGRR